MKRILKQKSHPYEQGGTLMGYTGKIKCDVCHVLYEKFFMLDVTHSHVDVETAFGVVSLILIFL